MSYDSWKTTEPEEFYPGPSLRQIADKLKALEAEIAWTERRLETLVLDEDDKQQTLDMLTELREEHASIEWCFNVSA